MAEDDIIIYNGISMRRDYAESLEEAQRLPSYRVYGRSFTRIIFGKETYPMVSPGNALCEDCSATRSQLHEPLYDREQCPICKLQVSSCDCPISTDDAVPLMQ